MIEPSHIDKLLSLARIDVSEEEKKNLARDVEKILAYVSIVNQGKGENLKKVAGSLKNVMREDKEETASGVNTEKLLSAAPKRVNDHIAVKNIFE